MRRYDVGGPVSAPSNPVFVPGLGMIDPMTGAPMPNYMGSMANPQSVASGQSPPSQTGIGQSWMPQQLAPQGATPQPQMAPAPPPQGTSQPAVQPSGGGSTLTSALSNPIVGALLGAGLGAVGGGRNGAIAGALGGPMLGNNMANQLNAAQTQDPNSSLAALSARYLPLLAASYAGSMYHNPTAPQYGKPASQSAALETPTPTGAPKPKPGSWYTYGQVPDYTLNAPGQAKGGMQRSNGRSSLASASPEVAPSQTGQHYIDGPGDGTSDDVPARLAKNEFVIPADVVSSLGNGSSDAGADKLYDMMHKVRTQRAPAMAKGKLPPKAKDPSDLLGEED